MME
ncbi:Putative uncharacterized protein [Escherichia coli D6-117.29]|jgi:hypothetical protein